MEIRKRRGNPIYFPRRLSGAELDDVFCPPIGFESWFGICGVHCSVCWIYVELVSTKMVFAWGMYKRIKCCISITSCIGRYRSAWRKKCCVHVSGRSSSTYCWWRMLGVFPNDILMIQNFWLGWAHLQGLSRCRNYYKRNKRKNDLISDSLHY